MKTQGFGFPLPPLFPFIIVLPIPSICHCGTKPVPHTLKKDRKPPWEGADCWKIYRLPENIVHSAARHRTLQRRQSLKEHCNTRDSVARSVFWLTEMGIKLILSENWWCGRCFQVKKADQLMGLRSGSFRTNQRVQRQRKRRTAWGTGCGFGGYLGAFLCWQTQIFL